MPWWLLGLSMVAATFSTDTPNFVTNVVKLMVYQVTGSGGRFLNVEDYWPYLYAKLWRKSKQSHRY